MSDPLDLTILIPALNEADSLPTVLGHVTGVVKTLTGSFEVLVVDGGSKDETVARAQAAGARVIVQKGRGFGSAVREGLQAARGRYIISMDGDGSHPAAIFRDLWERREQAQLIVASRYMPGGSAVMPPFKHALSVLLNLVSRVVLALPVKDSSSGLRIYEGSAVRKLSLTAEDFTIQQETMVRLLAAGGRVSEVPFHYAPRIGGASKADIPFLAGRYLLMLWRLRRLRAPLGADAALAGVLALGLFTGLWGVSWGLPGAARLRAFPDGRAPSLAVAGSITEHWRLLYENIKKSHTELRSEEPVTYIQGLEDIAPGWTFPPDPLLNSFRSILLRSENPDEQKPFVVLAQMRPWRLDFKPLYLHYGGAFIYPFGAFLKLAALSGAVVLVPDMSRYLMDPAAMGRLYLAGRLFILLFHLGTLWLLFDMGQRLGGWKAGALAAVFFALLPFVAVQTHTLKPHPYSAFWCIAAARFMLLAFEEGASRSYWLAGFCAGMAGGANLSFACFAMLPALAWLLRRAPRPERLQGLGACALAGLVIALFNPYAIFSPKDFLWELTVYPQAHPNVTLEGLFTLLSQAVPGGVGPLLGVLFILSLGLGLFGRDRRRRLLAAAAGLNFIILWLGLAKLWGWLSGASAMRFFYPVVGLLCVLAAERLVSWKGPRWAKALVLLAVLCDSGLRSGIYLENMGLDAGPRSTRVQAADWIEENVKPGATVGLLRFPQPATTPVFRYDRYRLIIFERPELLGAKTYPDYIVVNDQGRAAVENLLQNHYTVVRSYLPVERLWARFIDDSCFANSPMYIYERNGSNG